MNRPLHDFPGGLRLPGHKHISTSQAILRAVLPKRLYLPLHQHIGEPSETLVAPGDHVLKGQMIAKATDYVGAPVHASSSGTVVDVTLLPVPHASGLDAPTIVIETDGEDRWVDRTPITDYAQLDLSDLRNRIRCAGLVGLGGAAFPSFIKMNPGPHHRVRTLVLNGAECEPYITCDDMLMREQPQAILRGAQIMMHALQADECLVGIEDDKPQAIAAMSAAAAAFGAIEVVPVPTRYPAGGERQLIQVLTGKEVPSDGLPPDIGVVCQNVATAAALQRAIDAGEPLISRVVTVSGGGVRTPRNLEVLIGTPMHELIEQCGGYHNAAQRLVMGGPMMGFSLESDSVPVIKATNCVLSLAADELDVGHATLPCIRCGRCAEVCPASLLPQQLYWHAQAKEFDTVQSYNLFDCIECGLCSYVCPSHIPLVQYYRFAKTEIWAQERNKRKADIARQRTEFRAFRLARDKQERAARHAAKRAALKDAGAGGTRQAAIEAARERAEQKRMEQTAELNAARDAKIAEVKHAIAAQTERQEAAPTSKTVDAVTSSSNRETPDNQ